MGNSMKNVLIVLVSIFIVLATALILLKLLKKNRDFDHSDDTSSLLSGGKNDIQTFNGWTLTKNKPKDILGNIKTPSIIKPFFGADAFGEAYDIHNISYLTYTNKADRDDGIFAIGKFKIELNDSKYTKNPVDLGNYLNITLITETILDGDGQNNDLTKVFYLIEFDKYDVIAYSEQIPCNFPQNDPPKNKYYTIALKRHDDPNEKAFIIRDQSSPNHNQTSSYHNQSSPNHNQSSPNHNQEDEMDLVPTVGGENDMHTFNEWALTKNNPESILGLESEHVPRINWDNYDGPITQAWQIFNGKEDISTLSKLTSTNKVDRDPGMTALNEIKNMLSEHMENPVDLGNYLYITMITETIDEDEQNNGLMKEFYLIEFSKYDLIAYSEEIPCDPSAPKNNSLYHLALKKHDDPNKKAYLFC